MPIEKPLSEIGMTTYQRLAHQTAIYPGSDRVIRKHESIDMMLVPSSGDITAMFYVLGKMSGEVGELLEYVCKWLRGDFLALDITRINKELGDIQWYVAEGARLFGLTLSEVGSANLQKLAKRLEANAIKGSGEEIHERLEGEWPVRT